MLSSEFGGNSPDVYIFAKGKIGFVLPRDFDSPLVKAIATNKNLRSRRDVGNCPDTVSICVEMDSANFSICGKDLSGPLGKIARSGVI